MITFINFPNIIGEYLFAWNIVTLKNLKNLLIRLPYLFDKKKNFKMLAFTQMIDPVLSIAAALSVQSPFTSKAHSNYDAMVCVLRKPFL